MNGEGHSDLQVLEFQAQEGFMKSFVTPLHLLLWQSRMLIRRLLVHRHRYHSIHQAIHPPKYHLANPPHYRANFFLPSLTHHHSPPQGHEKFLASNLLTNNILSFVNRRLRLALNLANSGLKPTLALKLQLLLTATPLVVLHPSVTLRELRTLVNEMAEEEKVVLGLDGERVAHEGRGVDCECAGHLA